MKKMVIALVALGLLGGGAAGAYMYFNKPVEAAQTEQASAESGHEQAKGEQVAPSFVELEPLVLPVVDEDGVSQVISLVVALEVKDEQSALEVEKLSPRLKDAYIQDMYGALSNNGTTMQGGVIQVGAIKSRLSKISTKVLGENVVKDVLLQVVQQRPI